MRTTEDLVRVYILESLLDDFLFFGSLLDNFFYIFVSLLGDFFFIYVTFGLYEKITKCNMTRRIQDGGLNDTPYRHTTSLKKKKKKISKVRRVHY